MDLHYASVVSGLQVFHLIGDRVCGCGWAPSLQNYQKFIRTGQVHLSLTIANVLRYVWKWIKAIFALDGGVKIGKLLNYGWMKLGFKGEVTVSDILIRHTFHPIPFLPGSAEIPPGFMEKENERLHLFFQKLTRQIFLEDSIHDPARVLWEQKIEAWKDVFEGLRFNPYQMDVSISVKKTVIFGKHCHLEAKLFLGAFDPTQYVLPEEQIFVWPREQQLTINQTISGVAHGIFEHIATQYG